MDIHNKSIAAADRLIFALDVPDRKQAESLVDQLGEAVGFYKLGLEFFMSGDYFPMLEYLAERDKKIFVDLKFFDVPATVASAVRQVDRYQVNFTTVHGNQFALRINHAQCGPTSNIVAVPHDVIGVVDYRVFNVVAQDRLTDVFGTLFRIELRRMNANDDDLVGIGMFQLF